MLTKLSENLTHSRKKILLCDVDDVIVDLDSILKSKYKQYDPNAKFHRLWNVHNMDAYPEIYKECIERYLEDAELYSSVLPIPGSQLALKRLQERYDVCLLTAQEANPGLLSKARWLRDLFPFIHKDNIFYMRRKELVYGDVIIDDKVKNLMESKVKTKICFAQRYNEDCKPPLVAMRSNNWEEITDTLLRIL